MGGAELATIATQFGMPGLFISYLIWRERQDREAARLEAAEDRKLARERIDADLELARSMALLTAAIQGMN